MPIVLRETYGTCPPRIIMHGGEKVGKSTFASQAPRAVFLPCEEGLRGLKATMAVERGKLRLETFQEFENALSYVEQNYSLFGTVVIDSADWLEMLIHAKIAQDSKKPTIVEAAGGYGKGYILALDYWQKVLLRLDRLNKLGLIIIFICHSKSVLFNDPLGEPYDLWTMKLHSPKGQNGSLELLKEWVDIIAFASTERFTQETESTKTNEKVSSFRAIETGRRQLHLTPSTGFLAGNRYGLKGSCDLSWPAFMNKFSEGK